jgi:DNA mismatch repair ATPase MutS
MWSIARYYRMRVQADPVVNSLDDRTWADLDMDGLFRVLDRTQSGVGRQFLYARLRIPLTEAQRLAFESLITRIGNDRAARESAQMALSRLGDASAYDLATLAQPGAFNSRPWHLVFPILGIAMVISVGATVVMPAVIFVLAAGAVISLILRGTVAHNLRIVASAFRQVGPLLAAADDIAALNSPSVSLVLGGLESDVRRLARLRRYAAWAGRESSAASPGDLSGLVLEYLNLLFCLDANALFFGARELRQRAPELMRVIDAVGEVDAALSIASYRAGTSNWCSPTILPARSSVRMVNVRHPLLPDAVPNTVTLAPPHGLIITGSNMSGKSTFLRTAGVTAVLAQTISTCLADAYEAPPLIVRSCIGRNDDMSLGKSYYMVEVEMVIDLVLAAQTPVPHLMLFDELFRGTNAVERIAAGEAVLAALMAAGPHAPGPAHVVIAATHDQELVDLLDGIYAPFHFSDTIDSEGLAFDYRVRPGPAETRNAIALLGLRGAPPELVARALARAKVMDQARGTVL